MGPARLDVAHGVRRQNRDPRARPSDVHLKDLSELGFLEDEQPVFERWLARPTGLLLVCGPTGSGKTTTLYSALRAVASPDVNITTIEDPIEVVYEEFNQVSCQRQDRNDFGEALRHILRQDPDVILIGEIRDEETAKEAVQAALTGHLVLSTLHTNHSVGAVARLVDLKVPPFLVPRRCSASSRSGSFAACATAAAKT
jgi:general secretion pathway protein E